MGTTSRWIIFENLLMTSLLDVTPRANSQQNTAEQPTGIELTSLAP